MLTSIWIEWSRSQTWRKLFLCFSATMRWEALVPMLCLMLGPKAMSHWLWPSPLKPQAKISAFSPLTWLPRMFCYSDRKLRLNPLVSFLFFIRLSLAEAGLEFLSLASRKQHHAQKNQMQKKKLFMNWSTIQKDEFCDNNKWGTELCKNRLILGWNWRKVVSKQGWWLQLNLGSYREF